MTIIIFIIILGVLVLVHELGHFLIAKKAGVFVEEFGFGYPPRAIKLGRKWGTLFSINWIPFGGFVKIFGENYEEEKKLSGENVWLSPERSEGRPEDFSEESFLSSHTTFTSISKKWQAAILAAGVTFNIIFAWLLLSFGFMIGMPTPVDNNFGGTVKDPALTVISLLPESPAEQAGLKTGDRIKTISYENGNVLDQVSPDTISDFINKSSGSLSVAIDRGGENLNFNITPKEGLLDGKKIIGINMDMVGTLSLPIHKAFWQGGRATVDIAYGTVLGLFSLLKDSVRGQADVSEITGPVGIVGLVGDASRLGFAYIITFTALISINLAVINLLPFPALDGGRLLFVIIEGVTKRKINSNFAQVTNTVGFALLIGFMIFITYKDILKLF